MASSDDFREQLKAGNITEALALALSEAVELKITTWVASVEDGIEADQAKPGHRLRTRVNMIEGDIENEIGDQFLGYGRYRELRQFHLDQVAEGHKIIQDNLKSLQKLFEVLVTLRYPTATPPVIEPESPDVESPLLPPAESVTEGGLVIPPQEPAAEIPVLSPDTAVEEITEGGLVIPSPEPSFDDAVVTADTITVQDFPEAPPLPSEDLASFWTTPADSQDVLDSETDENDWDNSVLDLLESLPVAPPSTAEESNVSTDEDWGDLVEEEQPEPEPAASNFLNEQPETLTPEDLESPPPSLIADSEASNPQTDEEWGWGNLIDPEPGSELTASDFLNEQPETLTSEDVESSLPSSAPDSEASNAQTTEDWGWGNLVEIEPEPEPAASDFRVDQESKSLAPETVEPFASSSAADSEVSNPQIDDDDWGDMVEQEPEPDSAKVVPSMESLDLDDEDWDDWVVEEPEALVDISISDMESLDLGEDEDWDDLGEDSDPFATVPPLNQPASDLEIDENWDDFAAEELEPFSDFLDVDADVDASFDSSDPRENLTPAQSTLDESDHPDLGNIPETASSTKKDPLEELDRLAQLPDVNEQEQDSSEDLMEALFGETEQKPDQPDSELPDNKGVYSLDEGLFDQMPFDEFPTASEESDLEAFAGNFDPTVVPEDDLDANPQSAEKRVPPPPPPSRFPNQNN